MKTWKKVALIVGVAVVLLIIVVVSIKQANKGVVTVQTGEVAKQSITSLVTASGEIRPQDYTNVLGQGFGKITDIDVKEGDIVKRGDVLLRVESIQPAADVKAQQANLQAMQAGVQSAAANDTSTQADVAQAQANLDKAEQDWKRGQSLYKEGLIPKQDFDALQATHDADVAALAASKARSQQARALLAQSGFQQQQSAATLIHQRDVLNKTTYEAPISGIVTYVPVKVGENVVPGIQNAEGSFLLTLSDMAVVNAEVMVDETDIPNVKVGQSADVTIDAYPGQIFKGHVADVGEEAILRTSGLATTQQTSANSQEARDFKVHVRLDNPPKQTRPGLSCTAKIQTAHRADVLTIPIQALAMRSHEELKADEEKNNKESGVTLAAAKPATNPDGTPANDDVQGVFVVRASKAVFVTVQTGITGITDIEVTSGLKAGDVIVTGSYKALRTLRSGTAIKVDNSIPVVTDQSAS
ncbi:MAG TPA: efflux RND transporter periplasmic adaptor subunit [Candidatus Acidoferrales bacterium]|jgi:HlyD family secretion protein|nr:efflux RND transporter periplasmic adaptor subunit [Candidatus Acidoferrales bacterium]